MPLYLVFAWTQAHVVYCQRVIHVLHAGPFWIWVQNLSSIQTLRGKSTAHRACCATLALGRSCILGTARREMKKWKIQLSASLHKDRSTRARYPAGTPTYAAA